MSDNAYQTVTDIARKVGICMLTSTAEDGTLQSRPMATQEVEFDGDAWFFAPLDSSLTSDISRRPEVNVSYAGSGSWLSLAGQAEVVRDEARKAALWNNNVEAWFPGGASDPNVVLIRVSATSAQYWDTPGGKPVALLEMARARLRGEQPNPGTSETVDLD